MDDQVLDVDTLRGIIAVSDDVRVQLSPGAASEEMELALMGSVLHRQHLASAAAVAALPTFTWPNHSSASFHCTVEDNLGETSAMCAICTEDLEYGCSVMRMPCWHVFHTQCLHPWLQKHAHTCPMCRFKLPTESPVTDRVRPASSASARSSGEGTRGRLSYPDASSSDGASSRHDSMSSMRYGAGADTSGTVWYGGRRSVSTPVLWTSMYRPASACNPETWTFDKLQGVLQNAGLSYQHCHNHSSLVEMIVMCLGDYATAGARYDQVGGGRGGTMEPAVAVGGGDLSLARDSDSSLDARHANLEGAVKLAYGVVPGAAPSRRASGARAGNPRDVSSTAHTPLSVVTRTRAVSSTLQPPFSSGVPPNIHTSGHVQHYAAETGILNGESGSGLSGSGGRILLGGGGGRGRSPLTRVSRRRDRDASGDAVGERVQEARRGRQGGRDAIQEILGLARTGQLEDLSRVLSMQSSQQVHDQDFARIQLERQQEHEQQRMHQLYERERERALQSERARDRGNDASGDRGIYASRLHDYCLAPPLPSLLPLDDIARVQPALAVSSSRVSPSRGREHDFGWRVEGTVAGNVCVWDDGVQVDMGKGAGCSRSGDSSGIGSSGGSGDEKSPQRGGNHIGGNRSPRDNRVRSTRTGLDFGSCDSGRRGNNDWSCLRQQSGAVHSVDGTDRGSQGAPTCAHTHTHTHKYKYTHITTHTPSGGGGGGVKSRSQLVKVAAGKDRTLFE